jgi:magnesium transporter
LSNACAQRDGSLAARKWSFCLLTFHTRAGRVSPAPSATEPLPPEVTWIDAFSPEPNEVDFLGRALAIDVPSADKLSEIETSSRLYRTGDNLFLTVPIASRDADGASQSTPLGLIVTRQVLLTVHFGPVKVCDIGPRATAGERPMAGGVGALITLVEALVDAIADDLEAVTDHLDRHSQTIFSPSIARSGRSTRNDRDRRQVLVRIGQVRGFTSRISETLLVLMRMARYVAAEAADWLDGEGHARLDRIAHDAASLSDHENRLSEKLQFLLDATLGLIGVDQNDIFKILTMVSVVGIPPTLLASMYGMNFKTMPEYDWTYGYQYGLTVIFLSGLIPLLWFKWRGWW